MFRGICSTFSGSAVAVSAMAAALAFPAHAETETAVETAMSQASERGANEGSSDSLSDIVVTATRRNERLRDVPIAVTAIGSEALERQQLTDVTSLSRAVPNLQVKQTLNALNITAAIRGVSQSNATVTVDPPIGMYVDGVYNVVNAGSNLAMVDMERVEVLKGPQGTLFGRNTIGGAISITTAKPTNEFEGYVKGEIGNYGHWGGTAVVNLPVAQDVFDTRLVYQHIQRSGYGRNRTTGARTNSFNQDYLRGSARIHPGDKLEILLSGYYVNAHGLGTATRLGYFNSASAFNANYPNLSGNPGDLMTNYVERGKRQDTYRGLDNRFELKQYGFTGTLSYELGDAVTFKSITGYLNTDYQQSVDADGTPYVYFDVLGQPVEAKQFSQEVQLLGDMMDGKLNWIVGAYYFKVTGSQLLYAATLPLLAPVANRTLNITGPTVRNTSASVFAQASYELFTDVRLTAGVRYVVDKRRASFADHRQPYTSAPGVGFTTCNMANYPAGTDPAQCLLVRNKKYNYLPFTVGIDYKPDPDTLLYAKIARGYKAGAFPPQGPAAVAPSATISPADAAIATAAVLASFQAVAPEKLTSGEIGGKFSLSNNAVQLNVAGFYSRYSNLQLNRNFPAPCPTCTPIQALTNSGSTDIWGGEVEASFRLGDFRLDVSGGYADPVYRKGSPQYGEEVINISKFNGLISGTYELETELGQFMLYAGYSYQTKKITLAKVAGQPAAFDRVHVQKGYGLLDGRISLEMANAPVTLSVFAQNIANKKYGLTSLGFGGALAISTYFPGPPRTIGASVQFDF